MLQLVCPISTVQHAQILVIGGGPGGSYTASVLAREGFDVVVFEAAKFPRYHIGESLLPSVRHYLRFIDAEDKVASYGFVPKPGSAIKFNQFMQEGYTDFVALGATNNAWNVVRSQFDHLLLKHAASCGAKVYEQTRVVDVAFEDASTVEFSNPPASELGRPKSVVYETAFGAKREITFDYLVDASGRAGIMSTKYLKNRKFNASLKNVAVWGYWKNTDMYGEGTSRQNAPFFEALSDESGWAWFIPLHKGLTSVGVVMDQKQLGIRSRASSSATNSPLPGGRRPSISARTASTLAGRYVSFLQLAPGVLDLIGDGELVAVKTDEDDGEEEPPVARSASDYSYSATEYAGPGFRLVGDAGAFIDPFFSSGVHLAMTGALSAAASIAASIRGHCREADAARWHSSRVSLSYTRFLIVVLSAYKQIRAQSVNVLADIQENNFDKAFAFLRPVIQGGADMGTRLSEDEVQRALDFCVHLFDPTTPEQHESVRQKLEILRAPASPGAPFSTKSGTDSDVSRLFDVRAPLLDPSELEQLLRRQLRVQVHECDSAPSTPPSPRSAYFPSSPQSPRIPAAIPEAGADPQSEIRMVLNKVNARRVIHAEHGNGLNSLEEEELGGYVLRLKRGELGLRKVEPSP
ncbi:FAD/NAD(P)-binding domain-containing protein [Dichomitus squalens LYAD-421 SS1]|uniref:FAD/NAD(P)-binding domain-containing protein n=1 Tax=Dichomitus squalens (strain LYAD-421) TaxID=732165 RepID=UPI0004412CBB|nr:FAD/NAD(P)-binding domain-containing protein [Dichomitus squalens LYAD-421 SS1]EJF65204.1 FAD/NAD(P)-binding domain-containing protein [Dichomitus squalens LYAD-421 SS1]